MRLLHAGDGYGKVEVLHINFYFKLINTVACRNFLTGCLFLRIFLASRREHWLTSRKPSSLTPCKTMKFFLFQGRWRHLATAS